MQGKKEKRRGQRRRNVKTSHIKVNVEKGRNSEQKFKTIGDRVLTESSTDSSLYFDTARGPRSVCTMPVTGKTSGVVWDRISSFDAEWGIGGRTRTRTRTGGKRDKKSRKAN